MLRYFPPERRRRWAPLFLILGVVIVGKLAHDDMPRDQELTFVLPRSDVRALRVTYSANGELFGGFERRFQDRTPSTVIHTPSLAPGRYELEVEVQASDGGVTRQLRSIRLPVEDGLRIPISRDSRE